MQISGNKTNNFFNTWKKSSISTGFLWYTRAVIKRQEPGISPRATKKVAPSYFHWKIEEK